MKLGIIEFLEPEDHRFVVLDNVSTLMITGGVSVDVKRFVVFRVHKEAISCHEGIHEFEGKVHLRSLMKGFLS